jgi:hypothetical protein
MGLIRGRRSAPKVRGRARGWNGEAVRVEGLARHVSNSVPSQSMMTALRLAIYGAVHDA